MFPRKGVRYLGLLFLLCSYRSISLFPPSPVLLNSAPPSEDDRLTLHSNITHNLDGLEEPYNLDISERSFRLTLSDDLQTRRKLIGMKKSNGKELDSGHRRSLLEGSVSWQLDLVLVVIVDPENEVDLYALILGAISNSCMVCTSGDDDGRAANIECVPSLTRCYDITVEVNTRRPSLSPTYAATAEVNWSNQSNGHLKAL
jgi:hypothetical protein